MWALPDGDAYYDFQVRRHTTTDLTAERIHQPGLCEVARIEAEMDQLLQAEGYVEGSSAQRLTNLCQEPRFSTLILPGGGPDRHEVSADNRSDLYRSGFLF